MNRLWLPPPNHDYTFSDPATGSSTLQLFAKVVAICRSHHIDLRLFITPIHARLSYAIWASDLWPTYETWKRELVRILTMMLTPTASSRIRSGTSAISDATRLNLFAPGDEHTLMRWYHECSHYHVDLGDLVLNRVFDTVNPGTVMPLSFLKRR